MSFRSGVPVTKEPVGLVRQDGKRPDGISVRPSGLLVRQDGKRPDGLTLIPFEGGRSLSWDVTLFALRLTLTLILPCRVLAVWRRWQPLARRRNTPLCRLTDFQPIAVETPGPISESATSFVYDLDRRISLVSGEEREPQFFLFQRISVAIQRFNAVLLYDGFLSSDHPD